MKPDFILENEKLIIYGMSHKEISIYFLQNFVLIVIVFAISTGKFGMSFLFMGVLIPLIVALYNFFSRSSNIRNLVITKTDDYVKINSKKIKNEDLLFLSIREKENYNLIRLEAKRSNILFSNEKVLFTDTKNLEHALALCRQLRDFIDPNLKINQIKIGNSARERQFGYFDVGGNRNEDIEIWHYVD